MKVHGEEHGRVRDPIRIPRPGIKEEPPPTLTGSALEAFARDKGATVKRKRSPKHTRRRKK